MSNTITVAKEIWYELIQYIDESDMTYASDAVLAIMIDNDLPLEEMREAFKGDEWMSYAITSHLKDDHATNDDLDDWRDDDYDDEINEDY
jgi:hypothetical protein